VDTAATSLHASSLSEDAIHEAMILTKAHGVTSKEAKVAWDIVEEINASDNSVAYKGAISDDECFLGTGVDVEPSIECSEYVTGVESLASLMKDQQTSRLESKNFLANLIRPISLSSDTISESSMNKDSPDVKAIMIKVLDNAKAITDEFGIESSEARLAWEALEEIASNDFSGVMKSGLSSDECLVERSQACEAMDELEELLKLQTV